MRFIVLASVVALIACEPALPFKSDAGASLTADGGTIDAGPVIRVITVDGVSKIDASNSRFWVAIDLDTGTEATFEPPEWDLAFNRFHIRARGGASGDGGVQVAVIADAGFDEVTAAPVDGFLEDQPDGPDDNTDLDTVFEVTKAWYSYDLSTHVLTPSPVIYVVKTDQGAFFKVGVTGYYDSAGTPGILTLRSERLP